MAGIQEFQRSSTALLEGTEPVLVTRRGGIAGVYIPLGEPGKLSGELGREVAQVLGQHISQQLDARAVTEEEILSDFDAHRRRSR